MACEDLRWFLGDGTRSHSWHDVLPRRIANKEDWSNFKNSEDILQRVRIAFGKSFPSSRHAFFRFHLRRTFLCAMVGVPTEKRTNSSPAPLRLECYAPPLSPHTLHTEILLPSCHASVSIRRRKGNFKGKRRWTTFPHTPTSKLFAAEVADGIFLLANVYFTAQSRMCRILFDISREEKKSYSIPFKVRANIWASINTEWLMIAIRAWMSLTECQRKKPTRRMPRLQSHGLFSFRSFSKRTTNV